MHGAKKRLALLGGAALYPQGLHAIPWPPVDAATAKRLQAVYLSRRWSFGGPEETAFSAEWAAYHDTAHGICMANGTVTLEVALQALGVGRGDEVIVPAYTWMATAMAVKYVGAKIVFVDIEPDTLCLDPAKLEDAITPRTRAVIPVHITGSMADLDRILAVARKHGLHVVEDCAHMQGGQWAGRGVGSWGAAGSFSFQQSKALSSGEGGICITRDGELAERMARIKHIGYAVGARQGESRSGPPPGLVCRNYRMTEFQAVILRGQFRKLPALLKRYGENAAALAEWTADIPGVRLQKPGRRATRQGYYGLGLIFDQQPLNHVPLGRIQKALTAEGLGCGFVYGPVYDHPLFNLPRRDWRKAPAGCEVTDTVLKQRTLALMHPLLGIPRARMRRIAAVLRKLSDQAAPLAAADL